MNHVSTKDLREWTSTGDDGYLCVIDTVNECNETKCISLIHNHVDIRKSNDIKTLEQADVDRGVNRC